MCLQENTVMTSKEKKKKQAQHFVTSYTTISLCINIYGKYVDGYQYDIY